MSLTHTPAHTNHHPDVFEDDETGYTYEVFPDTDSEDPRTWLSDDNAALWVFNSPGHNPETTIPDHPVIHEFKHLLETHTAYVACRKTQELATTVFADLNVRVETATIRGYSQSDWKDVIAVVQEGYGSPESHIDHYRMWTFGDIWGVRCSCGESLYGIYADSPEEAVQHYRADHDAEHNDPTNTVDEPVITDPSLGWVVTSVNPDFSGAPVAGRVTFRNIDGRECESEIDPANGFPLFTVHFPTAEPDENIDYLESAVLSALTDYALTNYAIPTAPVSVSELLTAWDSTTDIDVDYFVDQWTGYLAGRGHPCPHNDTGLHSYSHGQCEFGCPDA